MIRLPQRSVTRFFIPLIDVLTLLFCIFLLLPVVQAPGEEPGAGRATDAERLQALKQENDRLRSELDRRRKGDAKSLQERLAVRVLEIDPATGRLYYRDPERIEVASQGHAQALVRRDRERGGGRELYYLVLYPRDPASLYPTRAQRETYDRWFEGVALGYDIPGH
jgi:hypothetical protein